MMIILVLACLSVFGLAQGSAAAQTPFPAPGTPVNPKVDIRWNRYYDYPAIADYTQKLATAHAAVCKRTSIGKSFEGRDIWCLTLTDGGNPDLKPAYYVDGNIHANEVQASEVSLYIAWYLCEMREQSPFVKQLLKDKTFYIVPSINPDGREHFFKKANNMHSPRSGVMPRDDDRDGSDDEDGYDDLDGDGHITAMWRKSPTGRFRPDPDNPGFMRPVPKGEFGIYEYLGSEGRDNDGDGAVNEDGPGYYDPNRDYPWNWQPQHTQWGAGYIPLLQPENRAVHEFFLAHPNIAGAMSYHNTGGMLLRGPGSASDKAAYSPQDLEPYDALGKLGELILPGYRYITTFEDLYQTYGAETDWMHGARGVVAYTGELWAAYLMFHKSKDDDGYFGNDSATFAFNKLLLFNDAFVPLKPYNHPEYGEIEIGGYKKSYTRMDPGFLLEEDAHRNAAFVLHHAYHTPKLEFTDVEKKPLGGGVYQITASVLNSRLIPTHLPHDVKNTISPPNILSIEGGEALAAMRVKNKDLNLTEAVERDIRRIRVESVPAMGKITVRWLVKGDGPYVIQCVSPKGGTIKTTI